MLSKARNIDQDHFKDRSKATVSEKEVHDNVLWEAFINKSESAFVKIYNDYFQMLFQYGRQFTQSTDQCKDIIQDLFIHLRMNRSKLPSVRSVKAFLMKSLRNRIFDEMRRAKKADLISYSEANHNFRLVPSHETIMIDKQVDEEQLRQIHEAISALSAKKREALYLFYFNCLSYEEIADVLGFSNVKSARTLIYRTLAEIRSLT